MDYICVNVPLVFEGNVNNTLYHGYRLDSVPMFELQGGNSLASTTQLL